jgi:hypothetical protein
VIVDAGGVRLVALVPAPEARDVGPGDRLALSWPAAAMHVMEGER